MGCMECMEWWTEVMMGDISRVVTSPNIYVADHGSSVLLEKILQTVYPYEYVLPYILFTMYDTIRCIIYNWTIEYKRVAFSR